MSVGWLVGWFFGESVGWLIGWLVGWLVGCLCCSRLGRAFFRPGPELVVYGLLSCFNQKLPRVASCNGWAWNMQPAGREPFVGTHIITQNKPDNKAKQTTQTQQTNKQHGTKPQKTNTTKQDKANQTTKPNQAKRKHTKPNPSKATHGGSPKGNLWET